MLLLDMNLKCFIFKLFGLTSVCKINNLERYGDLKENNLLDNKLFFKCEKDEDCGGNLYCCDYVIFKSCCNGGAGNYYDHPYKKIPIKIKK